jgi:hypothetical protein
MADLLRAAQWYARRGLHVHALCPRAKTPATPHGLHDATTDAAAIAAQWSDPTRNVAIATGPSGLCVIDVDGDVGAESLAMLEAEFGPLPITPEALTPRGRHIYFARGDHRIGDSTSKLAPKIDVRAAGGYVLVPPSVHPAGRVYRWRKHRGIHEVGLAPLPLWIAEALEKREPERSAPPTITAPSNGERYTNYSLAALAAECKQVATAPEGTRNATLNRAAFAIGQLVGARLLDDGLARGALIEAGRAAGLSMREAMTTANSGLTAGMREPRRVAS